MYDEKGINLIAKKQNETKFNYKKKVKKDLENVKTQYHIFSILIRQ